MEETNKNRVSLDEFLAEQSKAAVLLLATVEPVPDNKDAVRITPWRADAGCLCNLAFTVPKNAIDHLVPTEERHTCCGKSLRVVEVHVDEPHRVAIGVVTQQLQRIRVRGRVQGGFDPGGCAQECAYSQRQCLKRCVHLSGEARAECQEGCASDYSDCFDGCRGW